MATQTSRQRDSKPAMGEQGGLGIYQDMYSTEGQLFKIMNTGPGIRRKRPTVLDLENMLLKDSQATGLELVTTQPIRAASVRIEETEGDDGEADFARKVFLRPSYEGGMKTPLNTWVSQATGAFARRQAFWEIVWAEGTKQAGTKGKRVIDRLAFRRASTCTAIDYDGQIGFRQEGYREDGSYFGPKTFLPNKAVVYVHGASSTNPIAGQSAFEAAYQDYDDKQKLKLLYFMYLQKFGIPPIIATTDDPTREGQQAMLAKAEQIRAGAVVAKGVGEVFETLNAAQTVGGSQGGSADFREAFRYLDQQMAISMLVQFLMLGTQSQQGSWALSRDHSDLFLMTEEAREHEIEDCFNHGPMAQLIFQNFGPDAAFPKMQLTALSQEHESKAMDFMKAILSTGGAPPISAPIEKLILGKALAYMDITPDQIDAAEEEQQQQLQSSEGAPGGLGGGASGLLNAVRSIQSAPSLGGTGGGGQANGNAPGQGAAPVPAGGQQQSAFSDSSDEDELLEFISSPSQIRGPDGKFYPAGAGSAGGKSGGGGAIGSRSGGLHIGGGAKADPKARQARAAPRGPQPNIPEGKKKPDMGRITLPQGEAVDLEMKPLPQTHYALLGRRNNAAFGVFFLDIVQGRPLGPEEVGFVAQEASAAFDAGVADLVGRFDGQSMMLSSVNRPPDAELQAEIGLLGTLYGPRIQQLILDGQPIQAPGVAIGQAQGAQGGQNAPKPAGPKPTRSAGTPARGQ